jgi:hypothetical protein
MMTGLDDIFKSPQWIGSIQNFSELKNELAKTLVGVSKSVSGESMLTEIAKNMEKHHKMFLIDPSLPAIDAMPKSMEQYHKMFVTDHSLPVIDAMPKSMEEYHKMFVIDHSRLAINAMPKSLNLQAKFTIPQATIDAIASINRQHEQSFAAIRSAMEEALKIQSSAIAQIQNLSFALSGISGKIAAIAAQERNWSIIDDFEEVSKQAIEFSEILTKEPTKEATEEHKKQFEILFTLVSTFVKKYGVLGLLIIDIILRFADMHQYYDFLQQKPELATEEELHKIATKQDSIRQLIGAVNEQLKIAKEYRITNQGCEVMLKPKTKTLIVSKLPKDFELIVLQVNHKWILVSYYDPKDNLPQTGWILKKYLNKPE